MKVTVVGESYVGKSSFCSRYIHGTFSENYEHTIGMDFVGTISLTTAHFSPVDENCEYQRD